MKLWQTCTEGMKYRQLVVYLSKSLQMEEKELQVVRDNLTACGFIIQEYRKGNAYESEIRSSADFVLIVPLKHTKSLTARYSSTLVGKGQFMEGCEAVTEEQPAFIYRGINDEGEILMSKLKEDSSHETVIGAHWKIAYGYLYSYVMGESSVPLYPFITGHSPETLGVRHVNPREQPLTPKDCFLKRNFKLLLLE